MSFVCSKKVRATGVINIQMVIMLKSKITLNVI